jgi:hypothetical protein
MLSKSSRAARLSLAIMAGLAVVPTVALAAYPPDVELQRLGLFGSGTDYRYVSGGTVNEFTDAKTLNSTGMVIGYSTRYLNAFNTLGQDAWVWTGESTDPATNRLLGLMGNGYYSTVGGKEYRKSEAIALNESGIVVGNTDRHVAGGPVGTDLGSDAWYWKPTLPSNSTGVLMGLTTEAIGSATGTSAGADDYDFVNAGNVYRNGDVSRLNQAGLAVG